MGYLAESFRELYNAAGWMGMGMYVGVDGEIVIRPIMYLALSYDHRIIDGKEAVQFLISIKEALEDPARLLLKV